MSTFSYLLLFIIICTLLYFIYKRVRAFHICSEIPGTRLNLVTFFIGDLGLLEAIYTWNCDVWLKPLFEKHDTTVLRIVAFGSFQPRFYFRVLEPWFKDKKILKDRRSVGMTTWIPQSMLVAPSIGKDSMVWARHRKVVASLMAKNRLREYFPQMDDTVQQWLEKYACEIDIEITPILQQLTLDIFGSTMFGFNISGERQTNDEFEKATHSLLMHTVGTVFFGSIYKLWQWRSIRHMETTFSRVIALALDSSKGGNHLCSALKNQYDFSESEIKDEMVGLFAAGHETTANTLSWTLYLLALNPEIQKRAKEEIQVEFKDGKLTFDTINKNDLLLRIFHETMRVIPTVYMIGRDLHQSHTITYKNKKVNIPVTRGMMIVIFFML